MSSENELHSEDNSEFPNNSNNDLFLNPNKFEISISVDYSKLEFLFNFSFNLEEEAIKTTDLMVKFLNGQTVKNNEDLSFGVMKLLLFRIFPFVTYSFSGNIQEHEEKHFRNPESYLSGQNKFLTYFREFLKMTLSIINEHFLENPQMPDDISNISE